MKILSRCWKESGAGRISSYSYCTVRVKIGQGAQSVHGALGRETVSFGIRQLVWLVDSATRTPGRTPVQEYFGRCVTTRKPEARNARRGVRPRRACAPPQCGARLLVAASPMEPLVLQLQAECLDSRVSILEVLRKALVVARKLSLESAQVWIGKELNGYRSGDTAPPHRLLTGQIRAWNPYHGWQPVIFEDHKEEASLSKCFAGQPAGELENLVKSGKDTLQFPFRSEIERKLMEGLDFPLQATRHVSCAAISGIIDAVRNMVLEWCLQLEKDGILGEGLVFSARKRKPLHTRTTLSITTRQLRSRRFSKAAHTRTKTLRWARRTRRQLRSSLPRCASMRPN